MKCFFIIGILISVFVYFLIFKYPFVDESIGTKVEWADLSSVQYRYQKIENKRRIEIKTDFSKEVLIINKGRKKVFILLDTKTPPFYKQLPISEDYYLSADEYSLIKNQVNSITPTVELVLKSRIR